MSINTNDEVRIINLLLEVLADRRTFAVAGYNGTCERVVSHRGLIQVLEERREDCRKYLRNRGPL